MQLTTPRLRLDALHPADAEALFQYRADPAVCRYQAWRPASLADALGFIDRGLPAVPDEAGGWFQRAIRLADTGERIGDVGMRFVADMPATVELGISLSPPYQRQGYAAEALSAVMGFVFDDLRKHRVCASVDPRNRASMALLERLGLRQEAHFREGLQIDGEWVDEMIYAMLEREWAARRASVIAVKL